MFVSLARGRMVVLRPYWRKGASVKAAGNSGLGRLVNTVVG
jgi:hypothetical protein